MIPETMTAIELRNYDGPDGLAVTQKPVPRPGRGEVLVKIAAASVKPSDLMFIQGRYGFSMPLPVVGGFEGSGSSFFSMVRNHTIDGTFSDPYYGGNRDYIGWDMLGYPGVRMGASPDDVRNEENLAPSRQSAYDLPHFTKDPVGGA